MDAFSSPSEWGTSFITEPLFRGTPVRIPARCIGLLLEVRAGDERLGKILGIGDPRGEDQILLAVGALRDVEILGHRGISAIRNAILPKISTLEVAGLDFD